MEQKHIERVIISGGGSGGHIFPAVAIADEIKKRSPQVDILFVGANGKMEMEKVPAAGYKIIGLDIVGFQRKFTFKNFLLPFKIIQSLIKAKNILKEFKPQVVIGVGGYASGPTLKAAQSLNIPTLVQEQNSFPGKTNKLLAHKVKTICTAYEGLDKYFPKEKIVLTGNPVRSSVVADLEQKKNDGYAFYKLDPSKKTILIIGGSLGARTLNESAINHLSKFENQSIQLLWQCGKFYYNTLKDQLKNLPENVKMVEFIERMDYAYAISDTIISRAGAISVSELSLVHKPTILVPSPNVAEDHQTKNAMALVKQNAALIIKDNDAKEQLIPAAISLLDDSKKQQELVQAIQLLGKPMATETIVTEIEKLI